MTEDSGIEARLTALEAECTRLGDLEAIRAVRHRYCRSVNRGEWGELESCFAEDGAIDFGPGVRISGRAAVLDFYENALSPSMAMTVIHCHNSEIVVQADTARGVWEFDNFRVESASDEASRIGGTYEEEYVRVDDGWRIRTSVVTLHFQQPMEWRLPPV